VYLDCVYLDCVYLGMLCERRDMHSETENNEAKCHIEESLLTPECEFFFPFLPTAPLTQKKLTQYMYIYFREYDIQQSPAGTIGSA
jgi:hypothetical protein